MRLQVGETVQWTSQSQGRETTKRGVVAFVVPAGVRPWSAPDILGLYGEPGNIFNRYNVRPMWHSHHVGARSHESYIVAVPAKSGRGAMRLYWPRASALLKVEL